MRIGTGAKITIVIIGILAAGIIGFLMNSTKAGEGQIAATEAAMTMSANQQYGEQANVGYRTRYQELPAFDLIGFTKIVESGGELYDEVRSDGRWEALKTIAGDDKTIFGVASHDEQCPKGSYRYTVGVKAKAEFLEKATLDYDLFTIHIKQAGWLIFTLESFKKQYGQLWNDNPYRLVEMLGWSFDSAVGLHIDAYAASYASDHDGMEFMMPVTRSKEG